MKKLSIGLLFALIVIGCSSKSEVVIKDTDYLKYGTRAGVIEKVWGKPDETMAYQDYRAKGYYYHSGVSGSWGRYGGSVSGYGHGETYTPTTIVWTYKEKGYALFFEKRGLLFDERRTAIMVWRLVGWENFTSDQTTKPQVTPPSSGTTTVVTVTWTSANIRTGAGDEFPVLMTVNKGDKLTIIGERGEWFNVRLEDGKEGWIKSRVLK
jgi:hypothetical protein